MKMMKMVGLMAVGAALLVGTGCGKNKSVEILEKFANDVCACKDLACAQDLSKKLAEEAAKEKPSAVSEADQKAAEAATKKMQECMTKLATGAAAGAAGSH